MEGADAAWQDAIRRARDAHPVAPPGLGLRGVEELAMSQAGDAYAYSYGQDPRLTARRLRYRVRR